MGCTEKESFLPQTHCSLPSAVACQRKKASTKGAILPSSTSCTCVSGKARWAEEEEVFVPDAVEYLLLDAWGTHVLMRAVEAVIDGDGVATAIEELLQRTWLA